MQGLLRIHVPGLSVAEHYPLARERLMGEFEDVREVLLTTTPETLLVLHSGPDRRDAWRRALVDSVRDADATRTGRPPRRRHRFWWRGGPAA